MASRGRWRVPALEECQALRKLVLVCVLGGLAVGGCGGPLVMERVDVENGVVVGAEQVELDASGQVAGVREDGYIADDRYLKAYEYDDNLGPNAPGYIP